MCAYDNDREGGGAGEREGCEDGGKRYPRASLFSGIQLRLNRSFVSSENSVSANSCICFLINPSLWQSGASNSLVVFSLGLTIRPHFAVDDNNYFSVS